MHLTCVASSLIYNYNTEIIHTQHVPAGYLFCLSLRLLHRSLSQPLIIEIFGQMGSCFFMNLGKTIHI